jgi:ABC-type branched-subunit amino acid transport system substrate-binding protein
LRADCDRKKIILHFVLETVFLLKYWTKFMPQKPGLCTLFTSLLGMLLLVGCGDGSDSSSSNTQEPIKLGFLSSFTGTYNQNGFNGLAGVNLAVSEINASGGILGRQVVVVSGDDRSDPKAAVAEIRRLVGNEKIDALIGPISSQMTLATMPTLNEAKTPSISVSGSAELTPAFGPYHFSMLPSADSQAEAIVDYIATSAQARSAAIIYDDGAQATSTVNALIKELAKRNIELTGSEQYVISATDMTPQLSALRQTNPEVLIALTGTGSDSGYILKNRQELVWDIPVVGNITVAAGAASAAKIAGEAAYQGVFALNYKELTYCPGDTLGTSFYSKFKDRLRAFDPANYDLYAPLIVVYTYESVYALKAGLEGAKSLNGQNFAAWMETNNSLLSQTMSLPLDPSDTSHFLISSAALVLTENSYQLNPDGLMKRVGCP